jgi:hypothetical protein
MPTGEIVVHAAVDVAFRTPGGRQHRTKDDAAFYIIALGQSGTGVRVVERKESAGRRCMSVQNGATIPTPSPTAGATSSGPIHASS